jgi:hypothetical protein
MKRVLLAISIFGIILLNCVKISELPKEYQKYYILPKDLDSLGIIKNYEITKNKKNIENMFINSKSSLSGISILCGTNLIIKDKQEKSSIRTQISVTPDINQAKQLYETDIKLGILFKENSKEIDATKYNADQAYVIEAPNRFFIVLRKSKLVVTFDLEEILAKEMQLKELIINRFENIKKDYDGKE